MMAARTEQCLCSRNAHTSSIESQNNGLCFRGKGRVSARPGLAG